MKPPVAYYGGKTRIAGQIAEILPAHRVYVEPFAGSAAVLLAKPPAPVEILNDLNANVVAFYRCLRDRPDDLLAALDLTPYARDEYLACDLSDDSIDDLERARRWWVRSSQGFSGVVTDRCTWSSSSRPGATRHTLCRDKLADAYQVAARLLCVVIESGDAFDVIDKHDHPDGVVYADPPYLAETRADAWSGYRHELTSPEAHERLICRLLDARGAVVLSGYRSPLYDGLLSGWRRVEISVQSTAGRDMEGRAASRVECLWCNFDPPAQGAFDLEAVAS